MDFSYIKKHYNVPADMFREVIISNKKGCITSDMGHYIGVTFYDEKPKPVPCHPTYQVTYLETFNSNPPKLTKSQKNYQEFLSNDWFDGDFSDWINFKKLN
jgi:hypothetical protein